MDPEKRMLEINQTARKIFFESACVHKKWGLTHRPQSWLTTSGRSSFGSKTVRNRGATPKCHHSCKTAEHKSQITEICTLRPLDHENRACLSGCCPSTAVEVVPHYVGWDLLWVRKCRFYSCLQTSGSTCVNSHWVNLTIAPCICSSNLLSSDWMQIFQPV